MFDIFDINFDPSNEADLECYLQKKLADNFNKNSAPLLQVCETTESLLVSAVQVCAANLLRRFLGVIAGNNSTVPISRLVHNNIMYEVQAGPDLRTVHRLNLVVRSTQQSTAPNSRKTQLYTLQAMGRFNEVQVELEAEFEPYQERIGQIACTILQAGYRWLQEYVKNGIKGLSKTNQRIYSHLRVTFPENIADNIWLYLFIDNEATYIPDERTISVALDHTSKTTLLTNLSPLELTANFFTITTPLDQTFAKVAFTEDRTVEGNTRGTPYAMSDFAISEEAVLRCADAGVHPLIREGKNLLVAIYPVNLCPAVEVKLNQQKEQIKEIMQEDAASIRQLILQLRNKNLLNKIPEGSYGKMGELFGGFVGGLINAAKS